MSEIHIRRIKTFLKNKFDTLIDLPDIQKFPNEQLENLFLTRSLAAFVLCNLAQLDIKEATQYIIDDYDDNGIDAIYFDQETNIVYLVQSKWDKNGSKSPDVASIQKFINGFKDFIAGQFDRFNDKFNQFQDLFEKALDSAEVEFLLIIAYTGTQELSNHSDRLFKDLLQETNNPIDIASYKTFKQQDIYKAISGGYDKASINIEVTLYDWGQIREPYHAFYGQVSAVEIAEWYSLHNSKLLTRNLRKFKGDTDVNRSIKNTLISEPLKFWYYNNGITILCTKIRKKPIGGANRETGHFICEGVSVVNGAQTVGNISTAVKQGFSIAKDAKVLVRIISLENCPPSFAKNVTTATNTQNRIERRDFASQDPNHQRLHTELLLDKEKTYAFKSGERQPSPEMGCDIAEATVALACSFPDVQFAANAKRNIGILWEDITKPPYKTLFNEKLSASRLWNSVEILRYIEKKIELEKLNSKGIDWRVLTHGDKFIIHIMFQLQPIHLFDTINFDLQGTFNSLDNLFKKKIDEIISLIKSKYHHEYLNNLFKSGSRCIELKNNIKDLPKIKHNAYLQNFGVEKQLNIIDDNNKTI